MLVLPFVPREKVNVHLTMVCLWRWGFDNENVRQIPGLIRAGGGGENERRHHLIVGYWLLCCGWELHYASLKNLARFCFFSFLSYRKADCPFLVMREWSKTFSFNSNPGEVVGGGGGIASSRVNVSKSFCWYYFSGGSKQCCYRNHGSSKTLLCLHSVVLAATC